jgi:hypothetical protein
VERKRFWRFNYSRDSQVLCRMMDSSCNQKVGEKIRPIHQQEYHKAYVFVRTSICSQDIHTSTLFVVLYFQGRTTNEAITIEINDICIDKFISFAIGYDVLYFVKIFYFINKDTCMIYTDVHS